MLRLTKPTPEELARLLEDAGTRELSYAETGATRDGRLPPGYRIDRYERSLGSADGVFERAARALNDWKAHVGAGVEIVPANVPVAAGQSVLFVLRTPVGLWAAAPCRVIYTLDDADRIGFAYGTLQGHPEQGEAAMTVERTDGAEVVFRIVSFARPVDPLARAGSPLARRLQRRVTNRYLDALEAASASRGEAR